MKKFLTSFAVLLLSIVCLFSVACKDKNGSNNGDDLNVAGKTYEFESVVLSITVNNQEVEEYAEYTEFIEFVEYFNNYDVHTLSLRIDKIEFNNDNSALVSYDFIKDIKYGYYWQQEGAKVRLYENSDFSGEAYLEFTVIDDNIKHVQSLPIDYISSHFMNYHFQSSLTEEMYSKYKDFVDCIDITCDINAINMLVKV